MSIIRIGGEEAEYLLLTIRGRQFPASADWWDGNWLACDAEVAAGAFRGSLTQWIRNEELDRFSKDLETLYERLSGEASLKTLEAWIDLRVVGDGRGHMELSCLICDDPGVGNTLDFKLRLDQTDLPTIRRQIGAVCRDYPIVGQPGD